MADAVTNLQTALDNVALSLATITANPKPTYTLDGQTVNWTEYQKMLIEKLSDLTTVIAALDPYEIHSQGFT